MVKTIVCLPDGRQLSSGTPAEAAIKSFRLTQCVNETQELTFGAVCADMLELTFITGDSDPGLQAGQQITVYRETEDGSREKIGIFITEKPTKPTGGSMRLTAYDRVSLTDRDLTGWLEKLEGWPYTLQEFASMVCDACGVELEESVLPNGAYRIQKFYASGVTGRQLLRWVGQLAGRFCRCTPDGKLAFSWYREKPVTVGADGCYYFQNGLSYEDYTVRAIDTVQLRQEETDLGTVYPEGSAGENAYILAGNPLATASTADSLIGIAQTLYEQLQGVTYTPCKITLPSAAGLGVGDILQVTDPKGKTFCAYIMTKKQSGCRDTLECTGSPSRCSTMAMNTLDYRTLSGKVFNLSVTVEGLKAENRAADGKTAALLLDVEGISSEVSRQQTEMEGVKTQLTAMEQTAQGLQLQVRTLSQQGADKVTTQTGFTFDESGLTIRKTGTRMENLMDETGMYVKRSGQVLLQANQDGVTAVDVSVGNYLIVGDHARFEDYSSAEDDCRTACFWI